MLGVALSLSFALTGCTAPLPLPPAPPAAPPAKTGSTQTGPTQTEMQAERAGPVGGFSPETIAKVRRAMEQVTSLSNLFTAEMASTSDPKIQGAIYADFEKKYTDAVVAQGLSMSTYLQVIAAAAKDPKLSEELNGPAAPAARK